MSWLFDSIPYVLAAATIFVAIFQLIKEWNEYDKLKFPWLRKAVLAALVLIGVLTFVSLHFDNKAKAEEKSKSEGDIRELKIKAQDANDAQERNTKLFIDRFDKMSKEVGNLKAEVKTEALQKKLASVEADLQKTQRALAPSPKAELKFSFVPFGNPSVGSGKQVEPVTETTLPLNLDGTVHVEFTVINFTLAEAVNVDANLQICDLCRYAKEPEGTTKDPGLARPTTTRLMNIPRVEPLQFWKTVSVDVIPPPTGSTFTLGFTYRCQTCILTTEGRLGTVHILGR